MPAFAASAPVTSRRAVHQATCAVSSFAPRRLIARKPGTHRPASSAPCRFAPTRATPPRMRVATDGDSVLVHYTGFLDDGSQFDSSRDRDEPLNFVVGGGSVIRGFDDAVRGLSPGQSRRTRIESERAYGTYSDDLLFTIARESVPNGMPLTKGMRVPLSNGMTATVVDETEAGFQLDANHELAGKALTFDMELVNFAETVLGPPQDGLERAIFGLGCFWGAELAFQRVAGVKSTKVGYTHGQTENPTYQQVCSGSTGHAEVVAVDFEPSVVGYEALVKLFWERLGPSALTLNQAGNDVGTQYRSGIYYMSEEQKEIAQQSIGTASQAFGKAVVVEVVDSREVPFYVAEPYHQQYLEKGGQSAAKGATETIRCYG